jgi:hypothetical protein
MSSFFPAGNSLRFDGVDDLVAGTIDVFPRGAFTIMFWARGVDPARSGQALLQVISPEYGVELQLFNSQNLEVLLHGLYSGPTGIDINSGTDGPCDDDVHVHSSQGSS